MALYHRDVHGGGGQLVDVNLIEPLARLIESSTLAFDQLGIVARPGRQPPRRQRAPQRLPHRRRPVAGHLERVAEHRRARVPGHRPARPGRRPRLRRPGPAPGAGGEVDELVADWVARAHPRRGDGRVSRRPRSPPRRSTTPQQLLADEHLRRPRHVRPRRRPRPRAGDRAGPGRAAERDARAASSTSAGRSAPTTTPSSATCSASTPDRLAALRAAGVDLTPTPRRRPCTDPGPDDPSWPRRPAASGCARRRRRSGADLVFLDLEDACAPLAKEAARAIAVAALTELDWGRTVRAVRVNGLDTPWCHGDIIEVVTGARDALDVLIVPKARTPATCGGSTCCSPSSRRSSACDTADRARGADRGGRGAGQRGRDRPGERPARGDHLRRRRPVGVAAGRVDGNFDPVGEYPGDFWHFARFQVVTAARAAGIDAIDAPYPAYQDPDGYRRSAAHASLLGFDGKWAIHPEPDRRSPTRCSRRRPRRWPRPTQAIEALPRASEAEGVGAIGRDGRLVDAAHMRLAENILHKARSLGGADDGGVSDVGTPLRVVQWATGNIGTALAARRHRAPATWSSSGVYVHSAGQGRHATPASCAGSARSASLATDDIDEIVALGAGLRALHAERAATSTRSCRLLASGIERGHHPGRVPPPAEHGPRPPRARSRPPASGRQRRSTAPAAAPASSPRPSRSC